nr:MAG TPA: hypothetical protein [Caudoviricetes sp.]
MLLQGCQPQHQSCPRPPERHRLCILPSPRLLSYVPAHLVVCKPVALSPEQLIPTRELLPGAVIVANVALQIAVFTEPVSSNLLVHPVQFIGQPNQIQTAIIIGTDDTHIRGRAVVVAPDLPLDGCGQIFHGSFLLGRGRNIALHEHQECIRISKYPVIFDIKHGLDLPMYSVRRSGPVGYAVIESFQLLQSLDIIAALAKVPAGLLDVISQHIGIVGEVRCNVHPVHIIHDQNLGVGGVPAPCVHLCAPASSIHRDGPKGRGILALAQLATPAQLVQAAALAVPAGVAGCVNHHEQTIIRLKIASRYQHHIAGLNLSAVLVSHLSALLAHAQRLCTLHNFPVTHLADTDAALDDEKVRVTVTEFVHLAEYSFSGFCRLDKLLTLHSNRDDIMPLLRIFGMLDFNDIFFVHSHKN